MKILVYGAGNIGSLYAALLKESGQNVSILARGARLLEIRREGIQTNAALSGAGATVQVDAVEQPNPDDSKAEPAAEGASGLPLRWSGTCILIGVSAALATLIAFILMAL